jgi:hypothetical protein
VWPPAGEERGQAIRRVHRKFQVRAQPLGQVPARQPHLRQVHEAGSLPFIMIHIINIIHNSYKYYSFFIIIHNSYLINV